MWTGTNRHVLKDGHELTGDERLGSGFIIQDKDSQKDIQHVVGYHVHRGMFNPEAIMNPLVTCDPWQKAI
jgi:hypothetical protein